MLFNDFIIDCLNSDTTRSLCEIPIRIMKIFISATKDSLYIPGHTLNKEKQRAKLIQFGIILILIYAIEKILDETLNKLVKLHLKEDFTDLEIEWTFKAVQKYTQENDEVVYKRQHCKSVHLTNTVDFLQGKDLILSEYFLEA